MRLLVLLLAVGMCACSQMKSVFPEDEVNVALNAVRALANGKYEETAASFSADLQETLTANQLEARWLELTNEHGQFRDILSFTVESAPDEDGKTVAELTCHFEQGLVVIRVGIDSANEIVLLDIPYRM